MSHKSHEFFFNQKAANLHIRDAETMLNDLQLSLLNLRNTIQQLYLTQTGPGLGSGFSGAHY